MTFAFRTVNLAVKGVTSLLCRIESEPLKQVPLTGPLILVCNHINFLEVPLIFSHLQPRPVTGFAKAETWDSFVLRPLFNLWRAIPLRRGEADTTALRKGLEALAQGKILAIAPEGTRSESGQLQRGYPGIVTLALHSGAPLMPLIYYGNEAFQRNIRRLQRTDFHIKVGKLFYINPIEGNVNRDVRQKITDEIMRELAELLPPSYRGVYSDLKDGTPRYLRYIV